MQVLGRVVSIKEALEMVEVLRTWMMTRDK